MFGIFVSKSLNDSVHGTYYDPARLSKPRLKGKSSLCSLRCRHRLS
jgi:hypothetical protein